MIITNRQIFKDIPWDDYKKLPGVSFSSLKGPIKESEGMRLGSLVHKYILKPQDYNWEQPEIVRPIASELIKFVSLDLLRAMNVETGITADFEHDGFALQWKGMLDLHIPKVIVIDFKVLSCDLAYAIKRYKYPFQLTGYQHAAETDHGLIISYNKSKKIVEHRWVFKEDKFWENIVVTKGNLIAA